MEMNLTKEKFAQNLNTKFWLRNGGADREPIDLIELREGRSTARQEQYALVFRGDPSKIFPQRLYPVEHDSMGAFDLFLVPIGRDDTGTFYEAVFNHLRKDSQSEIRVQEANGV